MPTQAAGARAVPILCDASTQELERIFKAVNGLLIPGGGQDLSPGHPYYDASAALFKMTLAANDAGDFIPVSYVYLRLFEDALCINGLL